MTLKQYIPYVTGLFFITACNNKTTETISSVERPDTTTVNQHYVSNRKPLQALNFVKLPVGSIKPQGWLLKYLELQREGLSGQLGEISAWLAKENNAWLSKDGSGDHGWEEVPYWLKGYANLGYILEDKAIIEEAKVWLDAAIESQREDGYFGPMVIKEGKPDLWGNMIMLWCLQSYYEHSQDERVLTLMEKYFDWQYKLPDEQLLKDYWENSRGGDNLYSIYWLYNRTKGKDWLLDLAHKIHKNTADWRQKDNLPNWHNVNIAQCFREPATYFLQTGNPADVDATYHNFHLIRERYGNVPGGMFGADENAREGYTDPRQGVETCGMVEQMASNEILMGITGDPFWADHTEEVAFNTYPAAVMPDFKALRYITSPNMAISDSKNHHPGIDNNGPFLMMNPFSSRCCQHNHTQGWPYYAEHLFMATPDNGIAALLYSAAEVTAKVADGKEIRVETVSNYPFEDQIVFKLHTDGGVHFPYYLRIPAWCNEAKLQLNGEEINERFEAGTYAKIEREWQDGDEVVLTLPMQLQVTKSEQHKNSVSINRGPLTYSLKIKENYIQKDSKASAIGDSKWQDTADPEKWPSFEIHPASPWNYGLIYDGQNPEEVFELVEKEWPKDDFPFTLENVPISLKAKGKRIADWKIDQYGLTGVLPQSPVAVENQEEEAIELVPMGAARLRVTAFPTVNE
ncbi:glycoside hydrolase family 127 protein [Olivibacter sp. SDN3]|uniref:beta-L-arabinofuranosidase domain-containing protein n=1 Tax=Olivibacter sp. SDN3 TaxID=2764720 RepID=UPI0016513BA8|nr:beta-L-arabinofuranosidase domain-containing protein [Olivibacter sp. SDN3]QNL50556.1 glycoside hydrolase family 127 protein [Olivibacter sp. SDN3]